jgi:hypothetical protein
MAATAAASTRLLRIRRLASAINRSSEKGKCGTCTVIAPLSLAPASSVKTPRLRGHSGTLAQALTLTQPSDHAQSVRSRRLINIAAIASVVGLLAGCGGSGKHTSGYLGVIGPVIDSGTHSCGYIAVGKGWHLKATDAEACHSARQLMRAYFSSSTCLKSQRQRGSHCSVQGATCMDVPGKPDKALVWCIDHKALKRVTTATSAS